MAFRVATFNAGLAVGFLPYVTERLPCVIDALAELEVDLLFVQEFWLDAHWDRLRAHLSPELPHAMRATPVHRPGACAAEDVAPLVSCASEHCSGLADEALAHCVVARCAPVALAMRVDCLNCIASDPAGTLDEIVGRCIEEGDVPASPNVASALVAYGGSFGTGILSRLPLQDQDVLVFESTVNARGALHARIEDPELGGVHVIATHFSPGGAEQPPQVEQLLAWIEQKAGDRSILLLGDLNARPSSPLFERFLHAGFREPEHVDSRATYTSTGLGTGRIGESGARIDHVLTRNLPRRVRSERVLDRAVTVGPKLTTTLSDHFGVRATVG